MKYTGTTTMIIRNAGWWKSLAVAAAIGVIWILPAVCVSHAAPGLPLGVALSASAALGLLVAALVAGHGGAIASGAFGHHA